MVKYKLRKIVDSDLMLILKFFPIPKFLYMKNHLLQIILPQEHLQVVL